MLERKCVKNCDFMTIGGDSVSCELYDTTLKLEKFNPEHFTFTVLKCEECLKADAKIIAPGEKDKIHQLESELNFLSDYFYSFIADFEEAFSSAMTLVQTLKKEQKKDV